MSNQLDSNPIDNREAYAHGYDSALTLKMHTSRTVEKQAGWFLAHLNPGMTLLDCGCATGSITVGVATALAPGRVVGVDIAEAEIERARQRATAYLSWQARPDGFTALAHGEAVGWKT